MGKIIKDGFAFMEYANTGLIRKVDDIPALKKELITLSESKTHIQMSRYALLLAGHILDASKVERSPEIEEVFIINRKWQSGEARFQEARDVAGVMNDLAREEKEPIKVKVLRALGQVAATPQVRWHALAASEYAVVVINLMYPKDLGRVKDERERQIEMMRSV